MNLKCIIFGCRFKKKDWIKTIKTTLSWSARVVPVYERSWKCEFCGKIKVEEFISLADNTKSRINDK